MSNILIEAFAAAALLLPAFLLLNLLYFHNWKQSALYFLFALYLAAVYYFTGLPTVQFITFDVNLNLIPRDLFTKELVLSLLNVSMFVPLGFFLPLLWRKYRNLRSTALFGLGMTMAIELLQLLTYRATDVNDILTNFSGALLGYGVFNLFRTCTVGSKRPRDIPLIFLTVGIVMFFIQPLMTSLFYKIT